MDFSTIDLTWVTSAAVIGFIGSLTVAVVNAFAGRLLERAKSMRDYRAVSVAHCREFINANALVVGNLRRMAANPERFPVAAQAWMTLNADPNGKFGAIYTPGPVKSPFLITDTAQSLLHAAVVNLARNRTDDHCRAVEQTARVVFDAYALVEKSTELFVYGGLWTRLDLKLRAWRLNRKLDILLAKASG